jgi:hypothetical protein
MTTIPLGQSAYERLAAGVPEVVLQNRYVEVAPTNLREHTMLLSRPATTPQSPVLSPGAYANKLNVMRGNYFFGGLFSDSLFVVCGENLYRIAADLTVTQISGVIANTGHPEVAWMKGAGYEYLFISDGLLLQVYTGTTAANGTLTLTGTVTPGTDVFEVGGVYYGFGTGFSGSDAGSVAHPYLVNPTTAVGAHTDALGQLALAINDSGTPGVDYSATIGGANTQVSATAGNVYPPAATTVLLTALVQGAGGDAITTTVTGGAALSFGAATLQNGGIEALVGVTMPDGVAPLSLSQVSSYVLVSVANTQQFFWINPGELVIDALNFANKESSPDDIIAMRCTGDQVLIMGEASTENWYATGDLAAPFAPIEGRVYQRGALEGTPCIVQDSVMLVGNDGVAYEIGYEFGTTADWGVHRISNHGVEERIRRQIRREQGLAPI